MLYICFLQVEVNMDLRTHRMCLTRIYGRCVWHWKWNEHADEVNKINGAKSDNAETPSILKEIPLSLSQGT